tara:strand:- start:510 stop:731 length:222 start_codon:yes stop_codon:yes gene_type:complete
MIKRFEIGVYNEVVRSTLRSNRDLPKSNKISPDYENVIYVQRWADSKEDALHKASFEFPKSKGFVIDYCEKIS